MKQNKIEQFIFYAILAFPILDACSFLGRDLFSKLFISPTALIRLLILGILYLIILKKDKKSCKWVLIIGTISAFYAIFHLWTYQRGYDSYSFATWKGEIQYLFNYTYLIFLSYGFYWAFKNNHFPSISSLFPKILFLYLFFLYVPLLTHTSSSTYLDGIGDKGWFLSGNSLGASLLLLLLANFILITKKNYKKQIFLALLCGIFMIFFLGTRVGLYGTFLVLGIYLFIQGLTLFQGTLKKHKVIVMLCLLLMIPCAFYTGNRLLIRQRNLEEIANETIDPLTGKVAHVTGDTITFVKEIKEGSIENMQELRKDSYLTFYELANKYKVSNTDRRTQQWIYHTTMYFCSRDPMTYLFGNGYLNHYGEMILEMETVSLLYNFGILGFVLYLGWVGYFGFRNWKEWKLAFHKKNGTYFLWLFGYFFAFLLSTLTGYVYFNTTTALIILLYGLKLAEESEALKD